MKAGGGLACLLAALLGLAAPPRAGACPRRCACYAPAELHCTFRYLSSIPDGIPPDVERINLGYNSVVRLTETDFSGLSKLELLMLHSNGIHTVPAKTFSDLRALKVLKMSYNKVRKLQKDTFYGLRSLTRLHMDHNNIEFINPEVFYGLTFLQLVHLEGNQLTKLHPDTFVSLRYLQIFKTSFIKYLYLSDNFLSALPQEMVSYMPGLEGLYLHGNPWTCDCHLKWLSEWIREKPAIIKCKKDRSPSSSEQCPVCVNPRTSTGKPLATVPAAAFLCVKPTIDPSLKRKSLPVLEDSSSVSISPQNFMAPVGSLSLNMTDQSGNEANVVCSIQKPSRTSSIAFTEDNDYFRLNTSFSTSLVCNIDYSHIQPVWQILALYSDSPLILERSHVLSETPQLSCQYRQVAPNPEDIFTNIEADLRADPPWLMQDQISLQLNRTTTTLSTLQIRFSTEAQVTLPRSEVGPARHKWTMIPRGNNTKLEHTVLVGGTVDLDCPGQGDPAPHLEWLLADGSKVRAPYVSEDGRILIDKNGKLELRMADSFDAGVYNCISTNYADADVLTYRVTVVEPSIEPYHEDGAHHTVFAGEALDLPCHSTGVPDASVSWVLPGNTVLSQSSGEKQILNGTLRIAQVAPEDQGYYRCVVANPSGVDFLINQVSVKIKGPSPVEYNLETDGSGFGEPDPTVHAKGPPGAQLPTSAPMGGEAGKLVSSTSKKHRYRELRLRWRGDSTNRRFREHRRPFPPSARRIDPRHWAALLEKAKRKTMPQEPGNSTARPPPLVTQLLKIPGEEAGSSGMLPPDEEFMVLATKVPDVLTGTVPATSRKMPESPVATGINGIEVSPIVSPQALPPEKPIDLKRPTAVKATAMSKNINPTTSSKMQAASNQHLSSVFPLLPEATQFRGADDLGRRREHLQSAPPIAGGTDITDVTTHMLSGAHSEAGIFSGSENATKGHQAPVAGGGGPSSSHFYSRGTQPLGAPRLPGGPRGLGVPRNNATGTPLSGRLGRWRKPWGRGRITPLHRTPVLPGHRRGFGRPPSRGASEESTPEPRGLSAARAPSERPTAPAAGAALTSPASCPAALPQAGLAGGRAAGPTAPAYSPHAVTEGTTPAGSTPAVPPAAARTPGPTVVPPGEAPGVPTGHPSVSNGREAKRESPATWPPRGPGAAPPAAPTSAPPRLSGRSPPRGPVSGAEGAGGAGARPASGPRGSAAARAPRTSPALPTDAAPPARSTSPSANAVLIPPGAGAPAPRSARPAPRAGRPAARGLPFPPEGPSQGPGAHRIPAPAAPRAAPPTAPAPGTPGTRAARPRAPTAPSPRGPLGGKAAPSPARARPPAPAGAEAAPEPAWASTRPRLEDAQRAAGTTGLSARTLSAASVTAEPPRGPAQAPRTAAPESTSPSALPPRPAARSPPPGGPAGPAPPSPSAPRAPACSAPPSAPSAPSAGAPGGAAPAARAPPGPPAAGGAAPAQPPPGALAFTLGPSYLVYSLRLQATPVPTPAAFAPQNSTSTPSLWSENRSGHKSSPEIAPKGQTPGASMSPTPGLPEATAQASTGGRQEAADPGARGSGAAAASQPLPRAPPSGAAVGRPRIVGGKAASLTVPAGSDAFLPCPAVGSPAPSVHWTRVPSGLDLSARKQDSRFQVLPNGTLSIRRVDVQDRGQYLCSASNALGRDRLQVTVAVVSYPPRILGGHAKEVTVHSGSTVRLQCRAQGSPRPAVSWTLANQTVVSESSSGTRQALVTSDGTLVIHSPSVDDRGFYKCVASNPAGQDSLLVKVQVLAAPPAILEQKGQVIAGARGEGVSLPCTAQGTPQPRLHWVLPDGTEVKPLQFMDSSLFLFPNGTLYIRSMASSDRGTYECIATSSAGSDRRVVILTMEERETIPRIESASQTWNEVNLGDKLLLNCSATGEPKPQMIWRLPSKAVVDQWHRMGSRVHVYPNGSLFIGSITEKDGGDYLCVARNKMGDDLILMHVSLKLKPAKIHHKQHFKTQVLHGRDFQVDCQASGSPAPRVSWRLPAGTVVDKATHADGRSTGRYTLFDNGTLYFTKVGIAEEGDYTCYAQNTLGKDEMKVHLTVVTAAPRIKQGFEANTRARAGDTALLDCEVVGEPRPEVFWLLPSSDMISFSKNRYTFHANGSLSINNVKLLDSGEYVCVARSPSGEATRTRRLEVGPRPPLINGLHAEKTVVRATAVRHTRRHLDCRVEGTPPPQVTWVMPDSVVLTAPYYGSRIVVHKNGTLEIRNVRLSDSAEFTCVARNEGGESVLVVRLEVLEMLRRPTFRNPFNEKVFARLGKSTVLNCSVDGNPPPEIIWILPNGTHFPKGPNPQYLIANNGSFMIHKTTRDDAGKYRCGARNTVGYIEKLIVLEIGQKPVILTNALGTVYGISGDPLSLHCVSDGSPKPKVKWTVPSGHIIDRPQVSGKYELHENGTLVIKAATAYDRGNYVCKAQNSAGHALVAVPVLVVASPPRITRRPPRSVLTRRGAALQLHCAALGVPRPEVTWEMPDQSLLSMARKGRTQGTELLHPQGTLVIQSPRSSDSGMYKCTAKNALGSDFATTYVQVI